MLKALFLPVVKSGDGFVPITAGGKGGVKFYETQADAEYVLGKIKRPCEVGVVNVMIDAVVFPAVKAPAKKGGPRA